jgi:hypothetical protein
MLDDDNVNEVGDGGTSDAEGEGYECVLSFKDGMKEVELERLCFDANEIECGVEVDDNYAFVCEVKDNTSNACMERHQVGQHQVLQMIGIQPSI